MKKAVYPGSFDPVTRGHIDMIKRASSICDELVVGVLVNNSKNPLFSIEERVKMVKDAVSEMKNVKVVSFGGLLVDFVKEQKADFVIRGLRTEADFEYELQMAETNRILAPDVDTIFLAASLKYAYLSSSIVREVASFGGNISEFVTEEVEQLVKEKMAAVRLSTEQK